MTLSLLNSWQLLDRLGNYAEALLQLSLRDDQRRSESDDVSVSGLGLWMNY